MQEVTRNSREINEGQNAYSRNRDIVREQTLPVDKNNRYLK